MGDSCENGRIYDGNGYDRGGCDLCNGDGCKLVTQTIPIQCKWCGNETPRSVHHPGPFGSAFYVRCDTCKAEGPGVTDRDRAVTLWNRVMNEATWTRTTDSASGGQNE